MANFFYLSNSSLSLLQVKKKLKNKIEIIKLHFFLILKHVKHFENHNLKKHNLEL